MCLHKIVFVKCSEFTLSGFNGQLPLHRAGLRGDVAIVRLLLQHGADVNAYNDFNETPLHYACKRANLVVLQCMIEHGADLRAEDRAGKGVLHHAAHGGSMYVLHRTSCSLMTEIMDLIILVRLLDYNEILLQSTGSCDQLPMLYIAAACTERSSE